MEYKSSKSEKALMTRQIKGLLIFALGLIACLFLAILLLIHESGREDVVLVPPSITGKASISNHGMDASYLQALTMMVINDRLNLTPENVAGNSKNLLSYVSSKNHDAFKKQLDSDVKSVISGKITSAFYVQNMITDTHQLSVKAKGKLLRWVGSRSIGESKKTYLIKFNQSGFSVKLESFQEIKKEK